MTRFSFVRKQLPHVWQRCNRAPVSPESGGLNQESKRVDLCLFELGDQPIELGDHCLDRFRR